jgi:hypothetical protein
MLLFVMDAQDNNGRELLEEILIFTKCLPSTHLPYVGILSLA